MKKISQEELNEMLVQHELWLNNKGGEQLNLRNADLRNANLTNVDLECANLRYADLRDANLTNTDLRNADLRNANLTNADLRDADLGYADLRDANLTNTDLRNADLRNANLRNADLECANLRYADLRDANLRYANLKGVDLRNADLRDANLRNVETNYLTTSYHLACPEKGSFIGYKKAKNCLIELLILEDSKRSSATSMKCRCDKAKVLDIIDLKTDGKIDEVASDYDSNFVYTVGEIVQVDDFDEDRWDECATGIHFFMNKENAINY